MRQPNINDLVTHAHQVIVSVTATSSGAATQFCNLQPADGVIYVVMWAYGYHAAGGARTCNWGWVDPSTTLNLYADLSLNASTNWYLGLVGNTTLVPFHRPLICDYTHYLRFAEVATGAGEVMTLKALVQKIYLSRMNI